MDLSRGAALLSSPRGSVGTRGGQHDQGNKQGIETPLWASEMLRPVS